MDWLPGTWQRDIDMTKDQLGTGQWLWDLALGALRLADQASYDKYIQAYQVTVYIDCGSDSYYLSIQSERGGATGWLGPYRIQEWPEPDSDGVIRLRVGQEVLQDFPDPNPWTLETFSLRDINSMTIAVNESQKLVGVDFTIEEWAAFPATLFYATKKCGLPFMPGVCADEDVLPDFDPSGTSATELDLSKYQSMIVGALATLIVLACLSIILFGWWWGAPRAAPGLLQVLTVLVILVQAGLVVGAAWGIHQI